MIELTELCSSWRDWAKYADKSEDGWQSLFPRWDELMEAAMLAMLESPNNSSTLREIEFCWSISEETEDLADFAKDNIQKCLDIIEILSGSTYNSVRWQVYSILWVAGSKKENLLRKGLNDSDPYCQRRALLSLAKLNPSDSKELITQYMNSQDPYFRIASIELLHSVDDLSFKNMVKKKLLADRNQYVSKAALNIRT